MFGNMLHMCQYRHQGDLLPLGIDPTDISNDENLAVLTRNSLPKGAHCCSACCLDLRLTKKCSDATKTSPKSSFSCFASGDSATVSSSSFSGFFGLQVSP